MEEIQYKSFSWRTHQKNWKANQPNVCQFELTFKCGLRCKHCYTDCYNKPEFLKKELNTGQVKRILDKVHRAGVLWVCFTGGDPLTREDFPDIYAYAKDKGFIVTVFTNAYSMSPKIAGYFRKSPPFVIEMTLNGVTREMYERIAQRKNSFDRAMRGIDLIRRNNIPLKIKTQVTTDNFKEVPRIIKFLKKMSMPFRPSFDLFARLNGDTAPCDLRVPPEELFADGVPEPASDDDCRALFLRSINRNVERKRTVQLPLTLKESCRTPAPGKSRTKHDRLFKCAAGGGDGIHIDPYGNMFLCNLIRKPAFNLLEVEIPEAADRLFPWARNRTFVTDSKCRSCDVREYCRLCPGRALVETGGMESPVEYHCRLAKMTAREKDRKLCHSRESGNPT